VVLCVLFGALFGFVSLALIGSKVGPLGVMVALILAILPVPVYLAIILFIDRYEHEPWRMLAMAFFWGALVAFSLSLIFELMLKGAIFLTFGSVSKVFTSAVSPAIVEEGAKGLALFLLFFWKKDEFDGVIDGIVYASMVGLGFAMVENISVYGSAEIKGGLASGLTLFVVRGILLAFSHPLFTSMTGIGLGLARQSRNSLIKFIVPVIGLLLAMLLHFLYDFSAIVGGLAFFAQVLLVIVPVFLGVLIIIFFSLRREGRIVREQLNPELQTGLLSREEYDSLGSIHGRMGASFKALRVGGYGKWRTRMRFNQVASELAFQRNRVEQGITSRSDAEREGAYIQLLHNLKRSMGAANSPATG
jgi:RsiW-degrading membrane proteinase PrsW (M82 family)